jgi:hypothetical protein
LFGVLEVGGWNVKYWVAKPKLATTTRVWKKSFWKKSLEEEFGVYYWVGGDCNKESVVGT